MTKFWALILALAWIIPNSLSSTEQTFPSIADLAQTIMKSDWKMLDHSDIESNKTIEQKQTRIFQKFKQVSEILRQLEEPISAISYDVFYDIALLVAKSKKYQMIFVNLISFMQKIDIEYDLLKLYSSKEKTFHSTTMIDFAKTAVSHQSSSIKKLIKKIHKLIVPTPSKRTGGGILKVLANNKDVFDEIIRISAQSPHQYLYNLFNKIVITEIKAYVVIQFSYAILEVHAGGYFSTESSLANEQIRYILQKLLQETIQVTRNLSRHYWKDDPVQYRKGENYLEISRLLQGYVINEKILNNGKSCYGKCETFKEVDIVKCHNDPFCRKQSRCGGKVYSCRSLETIDMQICLAPAGTSRRYNYIEYANHNTLSVKSTCPTPKINVKAWIGWCPYCMCFCDDEGMFSDRYFSLKGAESDTENNKVVTGIRFAKKNKIIHLQIQQGEILPHGLINATTLEWVPVNNFKINDRFIYNGQDYLKMTWKDKTIDLNVIDVDNTHRHQHEVLTGVRFFAYRSGIIPNDKPMHLKFEIRMTKFHFESGQLFKNANDWYRNYKTEFSPVPRTKIPTNDLDIPTRTKSKNTIVSRGDQFVEFTHTDMFKDAGQTTVPFIDSQDVVTTVPTPLVGAGVYYKSTPGYGGFIGLKIVTYDFTHHL